MDLSNFETTKYYPPVAAMQSTAEYRGVLWKDRTTANRLATKTHVVFVFSGIEDDCPKCLCRKTTKGNPMQKTMKSKMGSN